MKIEKSSAQILELVNAEMAKYESCESVKATQVNPIDYDGRFDVGLRASGVPAEVYRPTVLAILEKLNSQYRLKTE